MNLSGQELHHVLIYIRKSDSRVVRSTVEYDFHHIPTSLKDYEVKIVTVNVNVNDYNNNILIRPYDFVFNIVHGVKYQPLPNIDLQEYNLKNLQLQAIEMLWKIAGLFIKNNACVYTFNGIIREVLEHEQINNTSSELDSLTTFLRTRDTNLDEVSYDNFVKLSLSYFHEKRKDIIKSVLISQERLIESHQPLKDMWEELKTIYIKF